MLGHVPALSEPLHRGSFSSRTARRAFWIHRHTAPRRSTAAPRCRPRWPGSRHDPPAQGFVHPAFRVDVRPRSLAEGPEVRSGDPRQAGEASAVDARPSRSNSPVMVRPAGNSNGGASRSDWRGEQAPSLASCRARPEQAQGRSVHHDGLAAAMCSPCQIPARQAEFEDPSRWAFRYNQPARGRAAINKGHQPTAFTWRIEAQTASPTVPGTDNKWQAELLSTRPRYSSRQRSASPPCRSIPAA